MLTKSVLRAYVYDAVFAMHCLQSHVRSIQCPRAPRCHNMRPQAASRQNHLQHKVVQVTASVCRGIEVWLSVATAAQNTTRKPPPTHDSAAGAISDNASQHV